MHDSVVDQNEVYVNFCGKNHPYVKHGEKSEKEVSQELFHEFRSNKSGISLSDWIEYYSAVSCFLDDN